MKSLLEIFRELDHDAAKWSNYFEIYERHLGKYRGQNITFVEIGVLDGGSLEMWSKYLGPQARIVGIDVNPSCKHIKFEQTNIDVLIGDQSSLGFWDSFHAKYPSPMVVLDDGGHRYEQQAVSFNYMFPRLPVGGTYIVEDLHTSYYASHGGDLNKKETFIEFTKDAIDTLHENWFERHYPEVKSIKDLTSIHCYDSIAVFEKLGHPKSQIMWPDKFQKDLK